MVKIKLVCLLFGPPACPYGSWSINLLPLNFVYYVIYRQGEKLKILVK